MITEFRTCLMEVLDSANLYFFILDKSGAVLHINHYAKEVLDATNGEISHKNIQDFVTIQDNHDPISVMDKILSETNDYVRCNLIGKEKRIIPALMKVTRGQWNDEDVIFAVVYDDPSGVLKTNLRQDYKIRVQEQRLQSIGTLASGIAHEINNPITGIINYAQLISERIRDSVAKEFCSEIIKEGDRIANIVRNLLSYAGKGSEEYYLISISEIVSAALSLFGSLFRKDQIEIKLYIPTDLASLECRQLQIEQVLVNLLTNARNALNRRYNGYHDNKIIIISAQQIKEANKIWIRMTVEDHGIGIPDKIRKQIFEPFFTTNAGKNGTGLGLFITKHIVDKHKGRIYVESEPNSYTKFHIDLPIQRMNGKSMTNQ